MSGLPALISDLSLILVLAGIVTLIFKKLKQPLVLGYIVAGFICSPAIKFLPSVGDTHSVSIWADIGVIFLMFSLGLEFSFKKIFKMGSMPFIAACVIIFCMIGLGSLAGHSFGWSHINSLFLGGMLAMSSTTVIYKALADMGLLQQRFASSVMSVLVVEDILGILLMVILSTIAVSSTLQGAQLASSLVQLALVLVVWFVVGVFLIPSILRKSRKLMSKETLLIVSLGLCFLMVVLAVKMNYSAAFGAFMTGSILAETIEAEDINKLVEPVKDLFGAIFFVSVGLLVSPSIIAQYWLPILILVLTIAIGQTIFGTLGYLVSGLPLKVAVQSGFCMAQIGEFAFIIASLGNSLHVTADFLYPVVVAVSVITTFLTPYMIRLANPFYKFLERRFPLLTKSLSVNKVEENNAVNLGKNDSPKEVWKRLMGNLVRQVGAYGFLSVAAIVASFNFIVPTLRHLLKPTAGSIVGGIITLLLVSIFLRAIVMRKNHSDDFKFLWNNRKSYRLPLVLTILVRYLIASAFVFYILNNLSPWPAYIHIIIACLLVIVFIGSQKIKLFSIRVEKLFMRNLHSRELLAEELGSTAPQYAERLLAYDVHLSLVSVPMNSTLAGLTLAELDLAKKYGVMVAAIFRQGKAINIPGAHEIIFPGDVLQIIGNDKALTDFANRVSTAVQTISEPDESREMILSRLLITDNSLFKNLYVSECGLREKYQCMLAGFQDAEKEQLTLPSANRIIREGDILWLVGERAALDKLFEEENS